MTRYYCDRCDDEDPQEKLIEVTVPPFLGSPLKRVLLCPRCLGQLHDWVRPLPATKTR